LGNDFHPEQIKYIKMLAQQAQVKKIIFISSTSIYPPSNQWAHEYNTIINTNTGNTSLFNAEQILTKDASYDLTIIRFGGLMGQQRIPGKYFSNKPLVVGDAPVNYIHQIDAIRMIHWIIEKELWNEVFNGVAPQHPKRAEVYEKNAADFNFPPPLSYAPAGSESFKTISADKILSTGFKFDYQNPLNFDYLT
jgi:nucleoside-diphosphate-sugar epimerase